MDIAVAGLKDREGLLQLLLAQFDEHDIAIAPVKLEQAIDGPLKDPSRGLFLLALVNGEAVGVAYLAFTWALEHGGKSAWLEELYVRPEQRQQGVGQAMLDAVCRMAKEHGCAAVDLEVEQAQSRA
ncbi:MAG TPA: GNAT family N-acetyltransferase, partial [Candidatus Bipolaricaulota bacterium]